jgi:hypothetical protein
MICNQLADYAPVFYCLEGDTHKVHRDAEVATLASLMVHLLPFLTSAVSTLPT